jgi:hypothetical protein
MHGIVRIVHRDDNSRAYTLTPRSIYNGDLLYEKIPLRRESIMIELLLRIRLRFLNGIVASRLQTLGVWSRSRGVDLIVGRPIHERQVL